MNIHNPNWPAHSAGEHLRRQLDALPPVARRKWASLNAQLDDATALVASVQGRMKGAEDLLANAQNRLARCFPDDTIAIDAGQAEVRRLSADLELLNTERARRSATAANVQQTVSALRDLFLPQLDQRVRAVEVDASPRKGEHLKAAIIRTRADIGISKAELSALRSAPPARAEIEAKVRAELQKMIYAGQPRVLIGGDKVTLQLPDAPAFANPGAVLTAPAGSVSRLLANLFPDALFNALMASVPDVAGVTGTERACQTAEIEARVAELEHVEEALVSQAIFSGLDVHRRLGASPWALLSIAPVDAHEVVDVAEELPL